MGGADVGTFAQGLLTHHSQGNGLATVVVVNLIAGVCCHAGGEGLEAPLLGLGYCPSGGLTLGLAGIHESHVALGVSFHLSPLTFLQPGKAVLRGSQQGLPECFCIHR